MVTSEHRELIEVCGLKMIVITRVTLIAHQVGGTLMFVGDKRPIAVICCRSDGEEVLLDERQ